MPPIQFICNQIMLLWEAALKFVFEKVQGFSGLKSRISFYALKFQRFDSRLFAFQIRHLIVICFEFSYFHSVINVSCSGFSYFHTATKMWPAEDFYISWTYDGLSLIIFDTDDSDKRDDGGKEGGDDDAHGGVGRGEPAASVYYDSGRAPSLALLTFVISSKHCVSFVCSQLLSPSIWSSREELLVLQIWLMHCKGELAKALLLFWIPCRRRPLARVGGVIGCGAAHHVGHTQPMPIVHVTQLLAVFLPAMTYACNTAYNGEISPNLVQVKQQRLQHSQYCWIMTLLCVKKIWLLSAPTLLEQCSAAGCPLNHNSTTASQSAT